MAEKIPDIFDRLSVELKPEQAIAGEWLADELLEAVADCMSTLQEKGDGECRALFGVFDPGTNMGQVIGRPDVKKFVELYTERAEVDFDRYELVSLLATDGLEIITVRTPLRDGFVKRQGEIQVSDGIDLEVNMDDAIYILDVATTFTLAASGKLRQPPKL